VQVEFGDMLAGDAFGCREPQHQPVVESVAVLRVDKAGSSRRAWGRKLPSQSRERLRCSRAREPENGDGRSPRSRCRGEDRVKRGRPSPQCFGGS
jgi:hypothetical protein